MHKQKTIDRPAISQHIAFIVCSEVRINLARKAGQRWCSSVTIPLQGSNHFKSGNMKPNTKTTPYLQANVKGLHRKAYQLL